MDSNRTENTNVQGVEKKTRKSKNQSIEERAGIMKREYANERKAFGGPPMVNRGIYWDPPTLRSNDERLLFPSPRQSCLPGNLGSMLSVFEVDSDGWKSADHS